MKPELIIASLLALVASSMAPVDATLGSIQDMISNFKAHGSGSGSCAYGSCSGSGSGSISGNIDKIIDDFKNKRKVNINIDAYGSGGCKSGQCAGSGSGYGHSAVGGSSIQQSSGSYYQKSSYSRSYSSSSSSASSGIGMKPIRPGQVGGAHISLPCTTSVIPSPTVKPTIITTTVYPAPTKTPTPTHPGSVGGSSTTTNAPAKPTSTPCTTSTKPSVAPSVTTTHAPNPNVGGSTATTTPCTVSTPPAQVSGSADDYTASLKGKISNYIASADTMASSASAVSTGLTMLASGVVGVAMFMLI